MALRRWLLRALLVLSVAFPTSLVTAQGHAVLHRMLKDGADFRVRVRAAMALAKSDERNDVAALENALWDAHPAVRAAAAQALSRAGQSRSLPALRIAARDKSHGVASAAKLAISAIERRLEHDVPSSTATASSASDASPMANLRRARIAVVIGDVRNSSGFQGTDFADHLRGRLREALKGRGRVAIIDERSGGGPSLDLVRRRRIPIVRVDANLVAVQRKQRGSDITVRCEVSVLVLDQEQRTIRSMLKGAATNIAAPRGPRPSQERLMAREALTGAVKSALTNAWHAIDNAATAARPAGSKTGPRGTYAAR